jgi:hypothetical protein
MTSTPTNTTQPQTKPDEENKKVAQPQEKKQTLFDALKEIGIYNITTLANRLGMPKADSASEPAPSNSKDSIPPEVVRAKELLAMMGLDDKTENASFLVKIYQQGREMLGEVSKKTITVAPIEQAELAGRKERLRQYTTRKP